ncbi:MAG: hypothetical protein ACFFA6_17365 [Promethearchaeota archaeon]
MQPGIQAGAFVDCAKPFLIDLPGNIGLGHADLVVLDGQTLLFTSLDGVTRSRLALVWE